MAEKNFPGKVMWTGDCLYVLRGMNSASVDLIYLDPPFNSNADYAAPIGSQAAGAAFRDTWNLSDVDVEWINLIEDRHPQLYRALLAAMTPSDKAYLVYMAARLLELRRVLKPDGSVYLHCDPTMSHYLKLVMDSIFGRHNYRNEVIWCYTGPGTSRARQFNRKHDVIHWYTGGGERWTFNADAVRIPHKALHTNVKGAAIDEPLTRERRDEYLKRGKVPETWWPDFSPVGRLHNERVGYPTQKPLALLDRIIRASSNPGDVVMDPFCGCATTCVAADDLGRDWIGIDISPKAAELVVRRIADRQGLFRDIVHRTDIPKRSDLGKLPRYNSNENRQWLYGLQAGNCAGCGEHFQMRHFEVDHIISRGKGGTDHVENLQLLCGNCNRVKGNRGMEYLRTKLQLD